MLDISIYKRAVMKTRRSLFAKFNRLPLGVFFEQTGLGFDLLIEPSQRWIDQNLYLRGQYEPGTLYLLRKLIRPASVFVDVGANIGLMSLYAAHNTEVHSVIAFEPDPENYRRFTLAAARFITAHKITILPLALGKIPGWSPLFRTRNDGGLTSLCPRVGSRAVGERSVCRLDDLMAAMPTRDISLIKIDVEGFELEVIEGALVTLQKYKPTIIMEFVDERALKAAEILLSLGYNFYTTAGKDQSPLTITPGPVRTLAHDNAVFVHEENLFAALDCLDPNQK